MKFLLCIYAFLLAWVSTSCDEIIMEDDISDERIALVAPADGSQLTSTSITFSWEEVEGASSYRLQVARPNFESPEQIVLDTLVTSLHFSTQMNIGSYQWRVKAANSEFATAFAVRGLSILSNDQFQNNVVVLQSPAHNFITAINTHALSWQPVIGATSYELQIFDDSGTLTASQVLTATSFMYTFGEGSYQWRVRASNGTQHTLFGTRSLFVDTVAPITPTLIAPANNTNLPQGDVAFQWSRSVVPGTVETDSIYVYSNAAMTSLVFKDVTENSPYTRNLGAGTYYWRMQTFDAVGNHSAPTAVRSFTAN